MAHDWTVEEALKVATHHDLERLAWELAMDASATARAQTAVARAAFRAAWPTAPFPGLEPGPAHAASAAAWCTHSAIDAAANAREARMFAADLTAALVAAVEAHAAKAAR
jgi:hypothetical protein